MSIALLMMSILPGSIENLVFLASMEATFALETLETLEMLPPPQQSTQTHPTKAPVAGAAGVTVGAVGGVAVGAAIVWTLLFRKRTGDRVVIQHTR